MNTITEAQKAPPKDKSTNSGDSAGSKAASLAIKDRPLVDAHLTPFEKLREARMLLLDKNQYLSWGVISMRNPTVTRAVPTAGVGVDNDGIIQYYFNPDFLNTLSVGDTAFVQAHEAMHIVSGHMTVKKENHRLWNICADVCVNTWLLNRANLPISDELRSSMWDHTRIGMSADEVNEYITAEDLYDILEPQAKKVQKMIEEYIKSALSEDMQEGDPMGGDGDGSGNSRPGDGDGKAPKGEQESSAGSTSDDHGAWNAIHESAAQQVLDKLKEDGTLKKAKKAGNVPAGVERGWIDVQQDFAWEKHMQIFMGSVVKREDTWERPPRRLVAGEWGEESWMYPMVPGTKIRHDFIIRAYVDMSGSIGPEEVSRFREVLRRHPMEVAIEAFSFDTEIYKWDNWETDYPKGGGGTDFQAVVNHAEQVKDKHIDGIVVLTDGYCSEPRVSSPRKWLWVSTAAMLTKASGTWVQMPPQGKAARARARQLAR